MWRRRGSLSTRVCSDTPPQPPRHGGARATRRKLPAAVLQRQRQSWKRALLRMRRLQRALQRQPLPPQLLGLRLSHPLPQGRRPTTTPAQLAAGPTFAHGVTKKLLHQEWNMGVDEAIEAEAEAQAICMQTRDFHRAYEAFVAKQKPVFEGN